MKAVQAERFATDIFGWARIDASGWFAWMMEGWERPRGLGSRWYQVLSIVRVRS
jgi:hypothetical protein